MNALEIESLIQQGRLSDLSLGDARMLNELLVIKDKIPFPVIRDCSSRQGYDYDIEDPNGSLIGMLLATRSLDPVDLRALSEWQLSAYLLERDPNEFDQPIPFAYDYVVIDASRLNDYRGTLMKGCEIWGGYSHLNLAQPQLVTRQRSKITAVERLRIPTEYHQSALERAIHASHPYERYLKYYHQLELLFDWAYIKKIQALQDDLNGCAKLISSYQSGDLPRLKDLIRQYATSPSMIHALLALVHNYKSIGTRIFDDFGKEGNPISGNWNDMLADLTKGYFVSPIKGLPTKQADYDKRILETAAYWIFRIRCCIAHHRIGEYLLSQGDEEFIVEFGEPLLLGVISDVLGNQAFHAIA